MGSQSSRLVNGQETMPQNSGAMRNQYMNQSGNSIGSMNDIQYRGNCKSQYFQFKKAIEYIDLFNFIFQAWKYGAKSVELTGTFNNWVNPIPLKKMENNSFEIILKLSPGVYQYKYIVDGEWRFSPDDPTCNDENGNINNIIDTTNIDRSLSLIGQNQGSAKFLAMGSQNNSANFMQPNNKINNSNGNMQQNQQQNKQNQPNQKQTNQNNGVINPQLQFSVQQQQFYAQLQQQQQMFQQQGINYAQQSNFQSAINPNQPAMNQNMQQMYQQIGNNPSLINTQMQQQQNEELNQQQDYFKLMQSGQFPMNNQQGNNLHPSQNVSPLEAMYWRASHNNTFDKSQLLIKAHITQQNKTNFDVAFKDQAPQMPPHLSEVFTMKKRNVKQISMWREKQLRPKSLYKSVFSNRQNNNDSMMVEESSFYSQGNGQNLVLDNTPDDDAEALMHVFQPGHSITPVDHVTLILLPSQNIVLILNSQTQMKMLKNHRFLILIFCSGEDIEEAIQLSEVLDSEDQNGSETFVPNEEKQNQHK